MYISYHSPHPNYAHQLFVTPSKHVYVLRNGWLKWQNKAIDAKLHGIANAEREHIVYYLLADHYSAAFYAEVHPCRQLPRIQDFLMRAWQKKDGHFFHGLPHVITTPKALINVAPDMISFIKEQGVYPAEPTSGFQAGIHQIRNFERLFVDSFFSNPMVTIAESGPVVAQAMQFLNESCRPLAGATRREVWENGVAQWGIREPK